MVDLSKIPVSKRFRIFWKHKDDIISCIRDDPKLLDQYDHFPKEDPWDCDGHDKHPFWKFMSKEDALSFVDWGRLSALNGSGYPWFEDPETEGEKNWPMLKKLCGKYAAHKSKSNRVALACCIVYVSKYTSAYLSYQMYSDEIDNTFILHLKEDEVGRLEYGRAKKEAFKIYKRNDLWRFLLSDIDGRDIGIDDTAVEIICGSITMKHMGKSIQKISNDGLEFETLCKNRLSELGYFTSTTKKSGDFGCDILAEKDDIVYVIQCKYTSTKIGVKAVQEALSARRYYKADVAVVITNGEYTSAANELAVENRVIIINDKQISMLENLSL